MTKLLFDVGDIVNIESIGNNFTGKGQIVGLRMSIQAPSKPGADVLFGNGKTGFVYLHDLARWNASKLEVLK